MSFWGDGPDVGLVIGDEVVVDLTQDEAKTLIRQLERCVFYAEAMDRDWLNEQLRYHYLAWRELGGSHRGFNSERDFGDEDE